MTPQTYEAALEQARKELAQSVEELGEAQSREQELEQRIADLRQTISILSKLCGQEDMDIEDSLGLTDAIRLAFAYAKEQGMTAQETRLRLETQGFNTRRYGNLLASIHTVIKRLDSKGEIRHIGDRTDGKPVYAWTSKIIPPPPGHKPEPKLRIPFAQRMKNFNDAVKKK
jgi:hypothetical protein